MVNTGKYTCHLNGKSSHQRILEQMDVTKLFRVVFGGVGGVCFKQTEMIKESKETKKICLGRKGSTDKNA